MPANQRVKGQDCYLLLKVDGVLQTTIDSISESDFELEQSLIEAGFLGEKSDRVDSVFNLAKISLKGEVNSADYLTLADSIVRRSQNQNNAPVRIDIVVSLEMPNGDFPSIAFIDVYFDSIPFNIPGRGEHVKFELTGKCSAYKIL